MFNAIRDFTSGFGCLIVIFAAFGGMGAYFLIKLDQKVSRKKGHRSSKVWVVIILLVLAIPLILFYLLAQYENTARAITGYMSLFAFMAAIGIYLWAHNKVPQQKEDLDSHSNDAA